MPHGQPARSNRRGIDLDGKYAAYSAVGRASMDQNDRDVQVGQPVMMPSNNGVVDASPIVHAPN